MAGFVPSFMPCIARDTSGLETHRNFIKPIFLCAFLSSKKHKINEVFSSNAISLPIRAPYNKW
jgi:hypothetical protein